VFMGGKDLKVCVNTGGVSNVVPTSGLQKRLVLAGCGMIIRGGGPFIEGNAGFPIKEAKKALLRSERRIRVDSREGRRALAPEGFWGVGTDGNADAPREVYSGKTSLR